MKTNLSSTLILALASVVTARAQTPQDDPLRDILFPPELVMQNQQALGLSEDQKNYLKSDLTQTQARFTEQQWKLHGEMERFASLLKQGNADEKAALAQLDNVLAAEREIKRTQIALLIRIRNHLSSEQQTQLRQIQSRIRSAK